MFGRESEIIHKKMRFLIVPSIVVFIMTRLFKRQISVVLISVLI